LGSVDAERLQIFFNQASRAYWNMRPLTGVAGQLEEESDSMALPLSLSSESWSSSLSPSSIPSTSPSLSSCPQKPPSVRLHRSAHPPVGNQQNPAPKRIKKEKNKCFQKNITSFSFYRNLVPYSTFYQTLKLKNSENSPLEIKSTRKVVFLCLNEENFCAKSLKIKKIFQNSILVILHISQ